MALEKNNLTIPLGGKLNEGVDKILLDKSQTAQSENVLFEKHGAVTKAHGCGLVTYNAGRAGLNVTYPFFAESFSEATRELLALGGYLEDASGESYPEEGFQFCAYDAQAGETRPRGPLAPITQSSLLAAWAQEDCEDPDVARAGGYIWIVWSEGSTARLYLTAIEEATGTLVADRVNLDSTALSRQAHILNLGTHIHVYHEASGTIRQIIIPITDPNSPGAPVNVANIHALKLLDVCAVTDPTHGACAVAVYRDTSNEVRARSWDVGGTLRRNQVLATNPAFDSIGAIGCAVVTDRTSGAQGTFLAYAFQDNAHATNALTYGMVSEDLVTTIKVAPTALITGLATDDLKQITMAEDPTEAWENGAANSAVRIWAEFDDTAAVLRRVRSCRAGFTTGLIGVEDQGWTSYRLLSKAWYQHGRSHAWLVYDGANRQSAVLGAYRGATGAGGMLPLSEAFNLKSAAVFRVNQTLPAVVDVDGTGWAHIWPAIRTEYADTQSVRVLTVDFRARGIKSASLDADRLVGGGMVGCFDDQMQDHSFLHSPLFYNYFDLSIGGGLVPAATYNWYFIYEWVDRNGLWHASGLSDSFERVMPGGSDAIDLSIRCLVAGDYHRNADAVRIGVYRTQNLGTTYNFVGYVDNDPSAYYVTFRDTQADSAILANRLLYADGSTGSELENTCPPPMTQICQHGDRIYGISEENPRELWATKPTKAGIAPEFCAYLIQIMPADMVSLASLGDYLICFSSDRIYALGGDGPDAYGVGSWIPPRLLTNGTGSINPRATAETAIGITFESAHGIEILAQGGQVLNLGQSVDDQLTHGAEGYAIAKTIPDPANSRIYFLVYATGDFLVFDHLHDRWTVLPRPVNAVEATIYAGAIHTAHQDGVLREAAGYQIDASGSVNMLIETAWLRMGNLTGFQRIWNISILGHYKHAHTLRVKMYVDYDESAPIQTENFALTSVNGDPYNLEFKPGRQKCAAVKFRIEDVLQVTPFDSADWVAVELTCGFKGPMNRRAKRS